MESHMTSPDEEMRDTIEEALLAAALVSSHTRIVASPADITRDLYQTATTH